MAFRADNSRLTGIWSSDASSLYMTVVWSIPTPCSLVESYRCFAGFYYLHHQGDHDGKSVPGATTQKTVIFIIMYFFYYTPSFILRRAERWFKRNVKIFLWPLCEVW